MATQESGSRGGDKNDHKAQLDGGLKMKIMRSKASDSGHESVHKSVKTESNGLQAGLKPNIGTSSSAKNKSKEPKAQPSVQCSQPPTTTTGEMFTENSSSVGIQAVAFNTRNIPVSKLFSAQNPNYQYSCRSFSSLDTGQELNEFNPGTTDSSKSPGKRKPGETAKDSSQSGSNNVQSAADSSNLNEIPPNKKRKESYSAKVNKCVGTSFGTVTEPECLGPCEPGTSVNLDGIVWHETEDGILVVNATWRGRSYVGTLLDSTRHDWAPPRPNDGNEDWDCRTRAGRAKRRNAVYGPELNTPSSSKPRNNNFKTRSSREVQLQEGTSTYQAKPVAQHSETRKSKDELSSNDESSQQKDAQRLVNPVTGLQVKIPNSQWSNVAPCPVSPVLLECPEEECSKKYKNLNGLRYHQSRVHGADCFDDDSMQSNDSQKPISSQQDTLMPNIISSLNNEPVVKTGEEDSSSSKVSFINGSDSKINPNEASELSPNSFSTINQDITRLQQSFEKNCDRDRVLNSKDSQNECTNDSVLKRIEGQGRGETSVADDAPTIALLSVKKDIFEISRPDPTEPNNEKSKGSPYKLYTPHHEHFPSILDGGRSPAYSDISDDSLSFSSSDFIDKLLKSTESKTPQPGVGGNFDLGFQPHPLQNFSNLNVEKDSSIPKSVESSQQLQSKDNIKKELDINEYSRITSSLPGQSNTTSSTFINPYNLPSSNFIADPSATIGDFKSQTNEILKDAPSKKENNSYVKEELREDPNKISQQIKQETVVTQNNSPIITSMAGLTSVHNSTFKSENEMHIAEKAQQKATETNFLTNAMENKCQSPNQFSQSRNSSKQQSGHSKRPTTSQSNTTPSSKNDQQRNQSPANSNRNIKEEKNLRIKQEPQIPPMSRSSGQPQFLHQPQYMSPSYPFVPAFSPYPTSIGPNTGYNMPYYNTQLPRYPLPADQSKQSTMTPQYVPSPTFGNPNFSTPTTLSNFSNTQTSPPSTMANINSAVRAQGGIGNGRPQTHFHTHHHTHVGLGYPVYAASYEGALLPSPQGTPAVIPTYSPRPTK